MFGSPIPRDPAPLEQSAALIEAAGVGLCVLDAEARILQANARWLLTFRLGREATGRRLWDLDVGACEHLRDGFAPALRGGARDLPPHRHAPDVWVECSLAPVRFGGRPCVLHTVREVTEQRGELLSLYLHEAELRASFANAAVGIAVVAPDGRFLQVNPAYCGLCGYTMDELGRERRLLDLAHPEDRATLARDLELLRSGQMAEFVRESRDVHRDGSTVWVRRSVSRVLDGRGAPRWLTVLAEDVTSRRTAETALRASERRFHRIFEHAGTGIAISGWDGFIRTCNPAFSRLLGYEPAELTGKHFSTLLHPDDAPENLELNRRLRAGELPSFELEGRYLHRDGRALWVRKVVTVLPEEPESLQMALVTDVDAQRRAEEALRQVEARFREALRPAPLSVAIQDRDLRFVWAWNQRTFRPEDIVGRTDGELFRPEEAAHLLALKQRVLHEGAELHDRVRIQRPQGPVQVDLTLTPVRGAGGEITGVASAAYLIDADGMPIPPSPR